MDDCHVLPLLQAVAGDLATGSASPHALVHRGLSMASLSLVVGMTTFLATPPAVLAAAGVVRHHAVVHSKHRVVRRAGSTIVGDFTLSSGASSFTCHDCHFTGSIIASGASLTGAFDIAGSEVQGATDLGGTRIRGALLASGVQFRGIVNLQNAHIKGKSDFSSATFGAPIVLDQAFLGPSLFTLAAFQNAAIFSGAHVVGDTSFVHAQFSGRADFGESRFSRGVNFRGAEFDGPTDFSGATFSGQTIFERSRFNQGARFLLTIFGPYGTKPHNPDSFLATDSQSGLNFSFASFHRPVDFEDATVVGVLSFHGATLPQDGVTLSDISAASLDMSVGQALTAVSHTNGSDDRPDVLTLLESSAVAHNNIALGNDAHFAKEDLSSQTYGWFWGFIDRAFYRDVAGYFVRPLYPLVWLLIIAALFATRFDVRLRTRMRAVVSASKELKPRHGAESHATNEANMPHPSAKAKTAHTNRTGPHRAMAVHIRHGEAWVEAVGLAISEVVRGTGRSLMLIFPGKKSDAFNERHQLEAVLYGALVACFLIAVANSNPTLRQMLNLVRA